MVRTDGGAKFKGVFIDYLASLGIEHRIITPHHPRAAGQVERINGILKEGFRLMGGREDPVPWWEALPSILAGLRMLPSRTHGLTPFYATFKQEPVRPADIVVMGPEDGVDWWATPTVEQVCGELAEYWASLLPKVRNKLDWGDI